jgi:hypothetical protein
VGGNNFIEVQPAMAKFAGFEINKINIIKLKIINKSSLPQRINVLPLQSPVFQIKFVKKGLLPSGMHEEL